MYSVNALTSCTETLTGWLKFVAENSTSASFASEFVNSVSVTSFCPESGCADTVFLLDDIALVFLELLVFCCTDFLAVFVF